MFCILTFKYHCIVDAFSVFEEIRFVKKYFYNLIKEFKIKDAISGIAWLRVDLCMYSLSSHGLISHSLPLEVMNKSPSAESNNLLYCLHRGDYQERTLTDHEHKLNLHCSIAQGYMLRNGWWYSVFQPRRTWFGWWIGLVLWKLIG